MRETLMRKPFFDEKAMPEAFGVRTNAHIIENQQAIVLLAAFSRELTIGINL